MLDKGRDHPSGAAAPAAVGALSKDGCVNAQSRAGCASCFFDDEAEGSGRDPGSDEEGQEDEDSQGNLDGFIDDGPQEGEEDDADADGTSDDDDGEPVVMHVGQTALPDEAVQEVAQVLLFAHAIEARPQLATVEIKGGGSCMFRATALQTAEGRARMRCCGQRL